VLNVPAQKQSTKGYFLPDQSQGINAIDSLGNMNPLDSIYTYNLVPTEYGTRLRKGYREWATGITGEVRTILPYDGTDEDNSQDRLFAASSDGIWNVTNDATTVPVKEIDFPIKTGNAGQGVFIHYVGAAGDSFMMYADEENGLFQYSETSGLWTQSPDPTGSPLPPTASQIVFIMSHKTRIWFVARGSADVWYFEAGANSGDATRFTLAGKLKHGGNTAGLWTWSIDGGAGVDDYLVIVSRGGDVVVYKGIDVEATGGWDQVGSWFIGELPNSRRIATEYGGELYLLAAIGIISMSDLLNDSANIHQNSPSYRVSRIIRELIENYRSEPEWQLVMSPGDNMLMIVIPKLASDPDLQMAMDLSKDVWGFWRGVPITCADTWKGELFMGDTGRVLVSDGAVDGTTIAGEVGIPIEFSTLSSYQTMQEPAVFKRVQFIRAKGNLGGDTSVVVRPIYDFDVSPILTTPPATSAREEDQWDVGLWDQAIWSGLASGASATRGGRNLGIHVAVAMRGEASSRLTFIGQDIMWDTGGLL
jgi:hypothetical protein